MTEALYLVSYRARGEAIPRPYDRKQRTRAQVLPLRRRLKRRGLEVFVRKIAAPIARKAPLAAHRKPATAARPIRRATAPKVRKAGKWDAWRARNRAHVHDQRVFCEVEPTARGTEIDHPFGRLGEPWASSHLVTVLLCGDHHRLKHRDPVAREQVRRYSLVRLSRYLWDIDEVASLFRNRLEHEPTRAVYQWLIDCAKRHGIQPPGWKET